MRKLLSEARRFQLFRAKEGDMSASDTTGWALFIPQAWSRSDHGDRVVVEVGDHVTENDIWRIGLGWPDDGELEEARAAGARAYRCLVMEIKS